MFRAKSGRSLFFETNENKEDSKNQNKHDLWFLIF